MLSSWHNIMCTKNMKITKNSRICELHFKPEDIIREDKFLQTDGTVIIVKRKNPKLKDGAVPSIFSKEKVPYVHQIEYNNNAIVPYEEFSTEPSAETISYSVEEPIPSTSHIDKTLQSEDISFVPLNETIPKFSAEDINIAKNIEVPTMYWFANINDNFMMWTCWANDLSYILRRIIVKTNLEVQVNMIE